ncbi:MAG: Cna B-type domain-containing protein [Clostridia bacterium]|nr:Cna B-type domain-containing protein [Clostridia bacterium]
MRKITALFVALSISLCLFYTAAFATVNQQVQVSFTDDGKPLENAVFSVYSLGDVNDGKIIPNVEFSSYKVSFDISDSEKLKKLADTLYAYILRDKADPYYTDTSDKNGIIDFNKIAFDTGAYLITAENYYDGNTYYIFEPAIVILPYGNSDSLKINPKFEKVPDDITSSYKVLKVWVGDNKDERPDEIEFELLRDGEVFETVILDSENNWKYQWDDLSPQYNWTVTEKNVPDNYIVSLSVSDKTFIYTNTAVPSESVTPPSEEITTPEDGENDKIPVTGLLRWPVPYLAMAGILLFIIGYVKYRKSEHADV